MAANLNRKVITMLFSRAYHEGYEANVIGTPRTDCPYKRGTSQSREWLQGWDQAEQDK